MRIGLVLVLLVIAMPAFAQDSSPPVTVDSDYSIGKDDVIRVQVWQRPGLSGDYVVDEQGNLNLPLVGAVYALGLTITNLGAELERRLVIMDPGVTQVLVTVTGYHSRRFTVVGEVRKPGTYDFRELPTLWDVILRAGGETPLADLSAVQIRRDPEGGGPAITLTADLSGGLNDIPEGTLPVLRPGDNVVLPSLESNYVAGDQIQVIGSVRSPGIYPLRVAGTVVEAISVSGGTLDNANMKDVRLARRTPDGTVVYKLNMDKYLSGGYPDVDVELQPGDTVSIPKGGGIFSSFSTVLQVTSFVSAMAAMIVAINTLNR